MIVKTSFSKGKLNQLQIYPIDLGYGKKLSESGIPRVALGEKAQKILQRIQQSSAALGTEVQMQNETGRAPIGVIAVQ